MSLLLTRRLLTISSNLHFNKSLRIPSFNASGYTGELWKLGKLNHIAIAVPSLEKSVKFYKEILRAQVSEVVALPAHGVSTVFINLGNTKLELLQPLGEKSPIEAFLRKNPEGGMHHICIEVNDIFQAIKSLDGKVRTLTEEPKIGAHEKPVIFLHPKDCGGVLIELEQE